MAFTRKDGKCGPLVSTLLGAYVAAGFILIMMFALYMTLLMSPELLRRILQDVIQCEDFPRYLSPNSSRADTEESGEFWSNYSETSDSLAVVPRSLEQNSSMANSKMVIDNKSLAGTPAKVRQPEKFSIVIGILTTARASDRRHQVRLAYAVQTSDDVDFTVRFVLGALEKDEDRLWVGMENATFGDIVILSCKENMNEGKTFAYFTTLVAMGLKYDYVMKTDDDSYVRLSNLGKQMSPMPRTDLYYGYSLRCNESDPGAHFLAGAGYIISWDLVLWINNSPIPRNRTIGKEDVLVGDWFRGGDVAKNRPFTMGLFYDYIDAGGPCAHELKNCTVLVHKLKSSERWQKVLAFFEKDLLSKSLTN